MKRFVWILLLIGALVQPLGRTGIYMLFQANRAYITSHLCEKRDVLESTCQGKCYLKKKLHKESKREQQAPGQAKQQTVDLIAKSASIKLGEVNWLTETRTRHSFYLEKDYPLLTYHIFHPPRVLA
ncbi:hypothetical protein CLV24_14113 [Pontibacter ummariensis]|uniref:Uncharacterized protein n=1 Tax=Pontibacter ummariensis TaxID=1610492 RepID=A0A239LG35_9BACT|nr:hypothetical protein [Pontibacter ummariensis]PRY03381.1 hypothetical protein CLV24_14113 [Pontibacter ummariensis]SNT29250.1 hypothetical protein SAMN06296052_14113 [Pontibacter ummariensis]